MYQFNAKKTWHVIKEVVGKTKLQQSTFNKIILKILIKLPSQTISINILLKWVQI